MVGKNVGGLLQRIVYSLVLSSRMVEVIHEEGDVNNATSLCAVHSGVVTPSGSRQVT